MPVDVKKPDVDGIPMYVIMPVPENHSVKRATEIYKDKRYAGRFRVPLMYKFMDSGYENVVVEIKNMMYYGDSLDQMKINYIVAQNPNNCIVDDEKFLKSLFGVVIDSHIKGSLSNQYIEIEEDEVQSS